MSKIAILDSEHIEDIILRINQLSAQSQPQWGQLTVAQMLHHCTAGLEMPLQKRKIKSNLFIKWFFGNKIREAITNDKYLPKSTRTLPEFLTHSQQYDFEEEKQKLIQTLKEFVSTTDEVLNQTPHPILGKFSALEWRKSQWKHLNHHLYQFNA